MALKDVLVGKPCPREFRGDVVRVAPRLDPRITASKRMPASGTVTGHFPTVPAFVEFCNLG